MGAKEAQVLDISSMVERDSRSLSAKVALVFINGKSALWWTGDGSLRCLPSSQR